MRIPMLLPVALTAAAAAAPLAAQEVVVRSTPSREVRVAPRALTFSMMTSETPNAVIGVTLATGDANDTLGVRVSTVTDSSPAATAGIMAGDRLQSVNGVSLKLAAVDVGDDVMANAMSHRLTRELNKLKPGDTVKLTVYHNGSVKTLSVKTVDASDLYDNERPIRNMLRSVDGMRAREDNRAALGVSLETSGSKRDTLGILITSVNDDGPAARAGLEIGNRVAAINGVNLKVDPADAGDRYVAQGRYDRLQDAMAKVKPGDNVSLQVYADGSFKTVQLTAAKASELNGSVFTFMRDGGPPRAMTLRVDGERMAPAMQRARVEADVERVRAEADVRQVMGQMRRSMNEVRLAPSVRADIVAERRGVRLIRF